MLPKTVNYDIFTPWNDNTTKDILDQDSNPSNYMIRTDVNTGLTLSQKNLIALDESYAIQRKHNDNHTMSSSCSENENKSLSNFGIPGLPPKYNRIQTAKVNISRNKKTNKERLVKTNKEKLVKTNSVDNHMTIKFNAMAKSNPQYLPSFKSEETNPKLYSPSKINRLRKSDSNKKRYLEKRINSYRPEGDYKINDGLYKNLRLGNDASPENVSRVCSAQPRYQVSLLGKPRNVGQNSSDNSLYKKVSDSNYNLNNSTSDSKKDIVIFSLQKHKNNLVEKSMDQKIAHNQSKFSDDKSADINLRKNSPSGVQSGKLNFLSRKIELYNKQKNESKFLESIPYKTNVEIAGTDNRIYKSIELPKKELDSLKSQKKKVCIRSTKKYTDNDNTIENYTDIYKKDTDIYKKDTENMKQSTYNNFYKKYEERQNLKSDLFSPNYNMKYRNQNSNDLYSEKYQLKAKRRRKLSDLESDLCYTKEIDDIAMVKQFKKISGETNKHINENLLCCSDVSKTVLRADNKPIIDMGVLDNSKEYYKMKSEKLKKILYKKHIKNYHKNRDKSSVYLLESNDSAYKIVGTPLDTGKAINSPKSLFSQNNNNDFSSIIKEISKNSPRNYESKNKDQEYFKKNNKKYFDHLDEIINVQKLLMARAAIKKSQRSKASILNRGIRNHETQNNEIKENAEKFDKKNNEASNVDEVQYIRLPKKSPVRNKDVSKDKSLMQIAGLSVPVLVQSSIKNLTNIALKSKIVNKCTEELNNKNASRPFSCEYRSFKKTGEESLNYLNKHTYQKVDIKDNSISSNLALNTSQVHAKAKLQLPNTNNPRINIRSEIKDRFINFDKDKRIERDFRKLNIPLSASNYRSNLSQFARSSLLKENIGKNIDNHLENVEVQSSYDSVNSQMNALNSKQNVPGNNLYIDLKNNSKKIDYESFYKESSQNMILYQQRVKPNQYDKNSSNQHGNVQNNTEPKYAVNNELLFKSLKQTKKAIQGVYGNDQVKLRNKIELIGNLKMKR